LAKTKDVAKGANDITSSILGLTKKKSMEKRLEEVVHLANDNNFCYWYYTRWFPNV
jgi:hypothetical protein